MTERLDARLAALERRLERASPAAAPPGLRRRVLSAVEETVDTVPATESRWFWQSPPLFSRDLVAGTVFVSAVAAAIAVVVFSASIISNSRAPLTLDERVRLTLTRVGGGDVLATLTADARTTTPALRPRRIDDIPAPRDTLRALDAQRILQEPL
jgi:hypothetical protein